MTTTVHGIPLSPFVRKVIMVLEAKGVNYNVNPVTPMNKPEGFEKISPLGKVPALEDDQVTLADSTVICEYLDQRYPEAQLYPQNIVERARVRWFEEFADTILLAVSGGLFFERIVKPRMMQQQTDEARVATILSEKMPSAYDYLESQLGSEGFLVGDSLTMADIAVGTHMVNAQYAAADVDESRWPKLAAYKARLFSTELFQKRLSADKAIMAAKKD